MHNHQYSVAVFVLGLAFFLVLLDSGKSVKSLFDLFLVAWNRWAIPLGVVLSLFVLYWRCYGRKKHGSRWLLPLYNNPKGGPNRPRSDWKRGYYYFKCLITHLFRCTLGELFIFMVYMARRWSILLVLDGLYAAGKVKTAKKAEKKVSDTVDQM